MRFYFARNEHNQNKETRKEEKPLFIYLQVRTSWNDKQIFKSTGVKILPSIWSTKNQRPLYAEFEEHTVAYTELKEIAQRLQSAKEQCEDITKPPKSSQTNKGGSKRLTSKACKTSNSTKTRYHQ